MISTTIFAIVSGFLAGLIPAQKFSENTSHFNSMNQAILYRIGWNIILGVLLTFLFGFIPRSDVFYFSLGSVPVIFGIFFLELLSFPKTLTRKTFPVFLPWPLMTVSLGNVVIISSISAHYRFAIGVIGVLFFMYSLSSLFSLWLQKHSVYGQKNAEDTGHILDFFGICNGLFLIIAGLLFFTAQIDVIESLLLNLF